MSLIAPYTAAQVGSGVVQAVEAAPGYALGHVAAGVGRGRLTFFVGNRKKVTPQGSCSPPQLHKVDMSCLAVFMME